MFDELFPIVSAKDVPRSLGFCRDLLGGTVSYQYPSTGDPQFVAVAIGSSTVGIGRRETPTTGSSGQITLWAYTDDCDAAIRQMRDAGITVLKEAEDQPWGERMAIVTDPDGNQVIIAARTVGRRS